MQYRYNSADNHLDSRWLPKDVWEKRIAAKYRDVAPKVVEVEAGTRWAWEGKVRGNSAAGKDNKKMQEHYFPGQPLEPGALPPSTPKIALAHMDLASTYASVWFGDTRKWEVEDPELKKEIYRAYNDFCLEMSAYDPDRLLYLPNLPTALPESCPAELERIAKMGARAAEFGVFDVGVPLYDDAWEPTWTAAADLGIVLCSHIGDKAGAPYPPNVRGSSLAHFSVVPFVAARPIAQMVFGGIFERHPKLNWVMAECRIGWIPFLIQWMDRQVHERPADPTVPLSKLPSDYIKQNVRFTFEEDYIGARMIPCDWAHIGDSVMWGPDYPHEQGTWPDATEVVDKMFAGVDPALKHEIVYGRMAKLFRVKGPQEAGA